MGRLFHARSHTIATSITTLIVIFLPPVSVFGLFFLDRRALSLVSQPETSIAVLVAVVFSIIALKRHPIHTRFSHDDSVSQRFRPPWMVLLPVAIPFILALLPRVVPFQMPPRDAHKNLIVIGVDTLRWDHVSCYGQQGHRNTPNIQSIADRGITFRTAISQAPWTLPAFASIMTGKYPHEHRALTFTSTLHQRELTLSELFRENGYFTGGFVSHSFVDKDRGFSQGFDVFEDRYSANSKLEITGGKMTDDVIQFVRNQSEVPFFLFVQFFDPHYDYNNHPDFGFSDGYEGLLSTRTLRIEELRDASHLFLGRELRHVKSIYDEEIAYTDKQIGRIVETLEDLKISNNTVIVVTSDHGEEFLERGWIGHTNSLYDEQIRVPLVISVLGEERHGTTVDYPVETKSIFPMMTEYFRLREPAGQENTSFFYSLVKDASAIEQPGPGPAFSQVWLDGAGYVKNVGLFSIRNSDLKVILDARRGSECAFDLVNDPLERKCLDVGFREDAAGLAEILRGWSLESSLTSVSVDHRLPDRDTVNKLRELGYVR